ncbi:hypothetical protein NQ318_009181 [Aromia moschata]|uniref:Uncharacterized protein n=1 Tax=Aromia moschata TaxID=1265417 RepID=A0AAV8XVH7_9CUCU|nr:hypothetical protein NQ318_009181 [Aromia moschata]
MNELFKVHFPGCRIISDTQRDCFDSELEPPNWATRENWQIAKKVDSFEPYKSPDQTAYSSTPK